MNRIIHILFAVLIVSVAAPARTALADEPTAEQLEQAKKAFKEGSELYEAGKVAEAIEKFKESYRLSKKPVLLYNIGHALDEGAKDTQKALFYYRKFLADAPKDAKQRKDVQKRVEQIEKENFEAELNGTAPTATGGGTQTSGTGTKPPEEAKTPVKAKPAGTYTAADFQHQMIDAAPPGQNLDVTAFVPEDSGWTVTLYYRGSGDAKFIGKPMKWRYKELVARIPGTKIGGSTIQYYVEVKDQAGNTVAKSGKSTSPNVINVDNTVPPRFYPDFTDDAGEVAMTVNKPRQETDEDPLTGGGSSKKGPEISQPLPTGPQQQGTGFADVGSSKFNKAKWVSTIAAGGLLAGAVITYVLGKQQASNIEADRDNRMGTVCMSPPCFEFDSYDLDVQNAGERYNTIHKVTMVTGVLAAGIAGYFWYKELTAKKRGDTRTVGRKQDPSPEVVVVPAVGEGFAGAAAAARF